MKPPLKGEGCGTPCSLERASSGNRCAACLAAATSYTYIHSSYSIFARRYEHARRALRAERRAALLGFPLPAAQRIDARYEKTCRAVAEKPPSRVRVVVGKGRYIRHTAPQVGAPCCGVAA